MDLTQDKENFIKLQEGNEQAFKTLFEKYYSSLCLFARQYLKESEAAEEAVQDMFVKIWEKRQSLHIETSVKNYLFRAVRNHCLNQIQHEKIKAQYVGKVIDAAHQEINPDHFFVEVDLLERIEKSINSLPPKRQEIFRLSREQGLKYKEIADQLNISVKTVEAQMGQALKVLREELKEYSNHLIGLFLLFKKSTGSTKG